MSKQKKISAAPAFRALPTRANSINEEARTVEVIFASEAPCRSWMPEIGEYDEILDCTAESCDMGRLLGGAQFLKEHDRRLVVGVVESARFEVIEGKRFGVAVMRFAKNALGEEEFLLAKDGIRRNYSVSYQVNELTPERVSKEDGDIYRATSWEALEISVVSVEADTNCKLLRCRSEGTAPVQIKIPDSMDKKLFRKFLLEPDDGVKASTGTTPTEDEINRRIETATNLRLKKIEENRTELRQACKDYSDCNMPVPDEMLNEALDKNTDALKFRAQVLDYYKSKKAAGKMSSVVVVDRPQAPVARSLGREFVESEAFKKLGARTGTRRSISLETNHCLIGAQGRANASSMFAGINVTQQQEIVQLGVQRLTIMDLFASGSIGTSSLKYPRENTYAGAAETVGEGGLKPNWNADITVETADVKKVAVTTKIPDEMMADFPAFMSYVDNRLPYMVDTETERQLLYGDGTGNNLTGIFQTSGIQTRPLGADTRTDAAYNALTLVRTNAFFEPDGYVFNPLDWEQIKLMKDTNGQYLGGGPFYAPYGQGMYLEFDMLWGKPVVKTTAIQVGNALAGAFKVGAQWFLREGMRIESTNANEDDFLHNLICLRAEHRLAFAVYRPSAFVEITGI